MKFHYTNLETCHEARGMVVVIDVIRAFTNAAFAFSRGAKEIYPVSTVEEALQFKTKAPEVLACGEVGGFPPGGFDFGNSPTQTNTLDLSGRVIVQRTGAGTQGVVRSVCADALVAASFVVADATVKHILNYSPEQVTFVITGAIWSGGEEDLACAEYLDGLLRGNCPDPGPFLERVRKSRESMQMFFELKEPLFPKSDLEHCATLNVFDFAMPITKENSHFTMRAIRP
jgi:2-phosphosulfolactate phosphatase